MWWDGRSRLYDPQLNAVHTHQLRHLDPLSGTAMQDKQTLLRITLIHPQVRGPSEAPHLESK